MFVTTLLMELLCWFKCCGCVFSRQCQFLASCSCVLVLFVAVCGRVYVQDFLLFGVGLELLCWFSVVAVYLVGSGGFWRPVVFWGCL